MVKNQYISLILFAIVLVTLINLYHKPQLKEGFQPINWIKSLVNPLKKTACALQGVECESGQACDCEKLCSNGSEFVPFQVLEGDRIFVMNRKLSPGTYCLPKGVGKCNLNTSYHIFSLSGWSCIGINDDIFKKDKKMACKNEEAQDNSLNVLWDELKGREADDDVKDYYEQYKGGYRYQCKCDSKSIDNSPMISVFPFVCLVDYCLRNFENPLGFMGWTGKECECGPYPHLHAWDKTSPCKNIATTIENNELVAQVECMNKNSFEVQSLICPTEDGLVLIREKFFEGNDPRDFVKAILHP